MASESYIIICRSDAGEGQKGPYVLATRTVFETDLAATCCLATIAACREPLIIAGNWRGLRFDEKRGTESYWGAEP
jgi:hypothetical protein